MALCQLLSARACTQEWLLQTTFTMPDGLADDNPALGILVKPLPEQFGDVYRRVAVRVCGKPAFTFKCAIPSRASISAPRTNLRSAVCINCFNGNAFLPCYVLKNLPKLVKWGPLYFSINFSAKFAFSNTGKVFNSNYCTILLRQSDDLVRYLVASCLIKISFTPIKMTKAAPRLFRAMIGVSLEFRSANTDITFSLPYVSTKIKLFQTSLCNWIINGNRGEGICSDIYANYLLTWARFGNLKFAFKYNLDNPRILKKEFKMSEIVTNLNKSQKPLVSIVFFDWKRDSPINCGNSENRVGTCSRFKGTASRDVIRNWQFSKTADPTFSFPPDFAAYILDELCWKSGSRTNNGINEVVKFAT